jgi:hypothetical protein
MSLEQYAKSISENTERTYGFVFPWMTLIEIGVQVLTECINKPKDAVAAAKNPTIMQKVGLRIRVKQETGLRGRELEAAVSEILNTVEKLPDDEIVSLYNEAKGVMKPVEYDFI